MDITGFDAITTAFNSGVKALDTQATAIVTISKVIALSILYIRWGGALLKANLQADISQIGITRFAFPVFISLLLSNYTSIFSSVTNAMDYTYESLNGTDNSKTIFQHYAQFGTNVDSIEQQNALTQTTADAQKEAEAFQADMMKNSSNPPSDAQVQQASKEQHGTFYYFIHPQEAVTVAVRKVMTYIVSLVGEVSTFILKLIVTFRLKILYVIGPFALAFSMVPAYENSLANFIRKMIILNLWLPLSAIVNTLIVAIINAYSTNFESVVVGVNPLGFLLLLLFVQIFLYFEIPKVAEDAIMIGQSGGKNQLTSAIGKGISLAITKGVLK
jgi:hypothetical protein